MRVPIGHHIHMNRNVEGMFDHVTLNSALSFSTQVPVVEKLDSTIHWINLYPVDNPIGFPNTCRLDSDLSSG